jgi:hypothetical protein
MLSNGRREVLLVQTSDAPLIANNPWVICAVAITIAAAVTSEKHAADRLVNDNGFSGFD